MSLQSEKLVSTELMYRLTNENNKIEFCVFATHLKDAIDKRDITINEIDSMLYDGEMMKMIANTNINSARMFGVNFNFYQKLSPKILIVKPNARLSWQYHHRRAEIWRVYKGECGIIRSKTDKENEMKTYVEGDQIKLKQGERHRLIGLDDYCLVAEIWQHTDKNNPSNEEDIVRVQDDFGR